MTIAKGLIHASLGIGMVLVASSFGCGGSSAPPAAVAPGVGPKPLSTMDSDNDGITDDLDQCPNEKEDGKGPNPKDGCPEGKGTA